MIVPASYNKKHAVFRRPQAAKQENLGGREI